MLIDECDRADVNGQMGIHVLYVLHYMSTFGYYITACGEYTACGEVYTTPTWT